MAQQHALAPPPASALWQELRVLRDLAAMLPALPRTLRVGRLLPDAPAVLVLPGFGAGDASTRPLRQFLRAQGLATEGWGLGMNRAGLDRHHTLADLGPSWNMPALTPYRGEGGVAYLATLMTRHVAQRAKTLGRPLALVGWSLGGTIAREVARDLPDAVSQVITLGSPVIGGPKYTAAAGVLRRRGLDLDWIEAQVSARDARPIQQPITSVIARRDGIVSRAAAVDRVNPRVRQVIVSASHTGLGFNPEVWHLVLAALRQPEGALP